MQPYPKINNAIYFRINHAIMQSCILILYEWKLFSVKILGSIDIKLKASKTSSLKLSAADTGDRKR